MARAKGTPNRVTKTVKDNVLAVYEMVGGRHGMAEWAKEHPTEFYRIYGRLAPRELDVKAEVDADVKVAWDK